MEHPVNLLLGYLHKLEVCRLIPQLNRGIDINLKD